MIEPKHEATPPLTPVVNDVTPRPSARRSAPTGLRGSSLGELLTETRDQVRELLNELTDPNRIRNFANENGRWDFKAALTLGRAQALLAAHRTVAEVDDDLEWTLAFLRDMESRTSSKVERHGMPFDAERWRLCAVVALTRTSATLHAVVQGGTVPGG